MNTFNTIRIRARMTIYTILHDEGMNVMMRVKKRNVPRSRSEHTHNPFLIFVEHLNNPQGILEDIDPRRRRYTYLISI